MKKNELIALVVDDMKVARLRLKAVCRKCGIIKVIEASTGKEAWGLMAQNNIIPQLILCDFNMPDMNGLEFLTIIRKNDSTKHIPVVFVTAVSQQQFIMQALKTGVDEVVIKPYTDVALMTKMKNVLAKL